MAGFALKTFYNNLNQISATSVGDFALSEDYIGLIVGENDDFLNILKNYSFGVCELDYGKLCYCVCWHKYLRAFT